MELCEQHKGQIARYFSFCKGKRDRTLSDRELEKEDFKSDRLADPSEIHTAAQVEALIEQFHQQASEQNRDDMDKLAACCAVYLSAILAQAEASGIVLETDISACEDQSRVHEIGALRSHAASTLANVSGSALPQLGALTPGVYNNDPMLHQEVNELKEENRQLKDRFQIMQSETAELLRDRSHLSGELEKVKANFRTLHERMNATQASADAQSNASLMEIENSLASTKMLLDTKQEECEQMRRDLNTRLGDSKQVRDLKSIAKKRSDEVKTLKMMMREAGLAVPGDDGGGVELEADDSD